MEAVSNLVTRKLVSASKLEEARLNPAPNVTCPKSPSASAPTRRVGASVVKSVILTSPATSRSRFGAFVFIPAFEAAAIVVPTPLAPVKNKTFW